MTVLFRDAHLVDPEGREGTGALLVRDGCIADVVWGAAPAPPEGAEVIDCAGRCLAPGIVDIGVKIGEPGERHKESFRSGGQAAAAGGVTTIVVRPDTMPTIDTPETLLFTLRRANEDARVRVLAMAALTKDRAGREMTEIGLLQDAGAVAFSDGDRPVQDTRIFSRALAYAGGMHALVLHHPQEPYLSAGAAATSGPLASMMGLPSVPAMAEAMQLKRDLTLAEMTGTRMHADAVSTARSLPVLSRAKDRGLRVTAGANIHHLTLNENDIAGYRTFFKLKPPLRAEDDRMATVEAVASGLIDVIGSFHTPQDEESKRLPFEEAASGAVGLETLLSAALQLVHAGHIGLPRLFACLSLNPSRLLGLESGRLAVGAPADLVLFDPHLPYVLDRSALQSKSKNTPFDLRRMQGRVLKTIRNGVIIFDREHAR